MAALRTNGRECGHPDVAGYDSRIRPWTGSRSGAGRERPPRIDLAWDADHGDPREAVCPRWLEKGKQRRIAHPHAPALRHPLGPRNHHRNRTPTVIGIRRHRPHGLNRACCQKPLSDPGRNAGPLRPRKRGLERRTHHALERPKEDLVRSGWITRAPVDAPLEARIVRFDELAGAPATLCVGGPGDAAIRAHLAGHGLPKARGRYGLYSRCLRLSRRVHACTQCPARLDTRRVQPPLQMTYKAAA